MISPKFNEQELESAWTEIVKETQEDEQETGCPARKWVISVSEMKTFRKLGQTIHFGMASENPLAFLLEPKDLWKTFIVLILLGIKIGRKQTLVEVLEKEIKS